MKHTLRYLHPVNFITVIYQLIFLAVTLIILSVLLYKPFVGFHPVGPAPIMQPYTQEYLNTHKPLKVRTGMHIADFLKFDTVKNEFILNAFIWFEYDKDIDSEIIDAFAFTKGEILQKSAATITELNGIKRALYTIRIQFSTILDFARFPLDDHRIFLNLINTKLPADKLIYVATKDDFIISKNIFVSGWNVVSHSVASGYAQIPLSNTLSMLQNKTVFTLDFSKKDIRQLILIVLPLLFLFYLGLFAFSIRDIAVAMSLPLASISGLFAYSFVIQILAPTVGYMMMSDYMFFFFLLSAFIIFIVKALAAVPETHLSRSTLRIIEGITIIALQIALIVVWYLLLDVRKF